jgi:hypothetical protein
MLSSEPKTVQRMDAMVAEGMPTSKRDHAEASQPRAEALKAGTHRAKVAAALERVVREEAGVLERLKDA